MNQGHLYAILTGAVGVFLLLGWMYGTTGNPRSNNILLKSAPLFLLPGAILIAIPEKWVQFPLSMWALVLVEEGIKAISAATEERRMNRFAFVALFGIWELMIAKPVWGIEHSGVLEGWSRMQLVGLTAAGMVTVLMHAVTAEIYAFRFEGRLTAAFAVSCLVHIVFNESVDLFGVSRFGALLQFLVLAVLFVALWPKAPTPSRPHSSSSS